MHYYKFNIPDWVLHTAHLSPEEEGVYLRLVNFYYDTEQPIPEETQSVIRRLRLVNCTDVVSVILAEFFTLESGFWHHKRCDIEVERYHEKATTNKANGSKGGRPRGSSHSPKKPDKPKKTQSVNSGNPEITLTKNHKPTTNNQKEDEYSYRKLRFPRSLEGLESEIKEFIDHRVNLKKPLTQRALDRFLAAVFDTSSALNIPANTVISETIDAGWQSVKTDWLRNRLSNNNQNPRQAKSGSTRARSITDDLQDCSWAN